jgi:hypothetical protein
MEFSPAIPKSCATSLHSLPPLLHFGEVLRSADRRQDGDGDDADQFVAFVIAIISARISKLRKRVQY